jgi:hypothetical protein
MLSDLMGNIVRIYSFEDIFKFVILGLIAVMLLRCKERELKLLGKGLAVFVLLLWIPLLLVLWITYELAKGLIWNTLKPIVYYGTAMTLGGVVGMIIFRIFFFR